MFRGELPLCEEKGCAYVPPDDSKEVEPYQGLIKPDIVFFGESLPDRFSKCVMEVSMCACECGCDEGELVCVCVPG